MVAYKMKLKMITREGNVCVVRRTPLLWIYCGCLVCSKSSNKPFSVWLFISFSIVRKSLCCCSVEYKDRGQFMWLIWRKNYYIQLKTQTKNQLHCTVNSHWSVVIGNKDWVCHETLSVLGKLYGMLLRLRSLWNGIFEWRQRNDKMLANLM